MRPQVHPPASDPGHNQNLGGQGEEWQACLKAPPLDLSPTKVREPLSKRTEGKKAEPCLCSRGLTSGHPGAKETFKLKDGKGDPWGLSLGQPQRTCRSARGGPATREMSIPEGRVSSSRCCKSIHEWGVLTEKVLSDRLAQGQKTGVDETPLRGKAIVRLGAALDEPAPRRQTF